METKANHVLIGAFTLAVVVAALVFTYWLARIEGAAGRQPLYVIFESVVTGLTEGGAVLFNGIKVGEVAKLEFDPENPGRVRALVYVDRNTPIKEDTKARLDAQGLTGVSVIQLIGGSRDARPISEVPGDDIPEILADKSQLQDLIDSVRTIASRGADLFERLDTLIEKNEQAVGQSIDNIRRVTGSLADNSEEISQFIKDAGELAGRLNATSQKLDSLIERTDRLMATDADAFVKEARAAAESFRRFADNLDRDLSGRAGRSLREVEAFASEGRSTVRSMQRVIEQLESDPRSFLLGGSRVPEHGGR